jgi:hypothetical protein
MGTVQTIKNTIFVAENYTGTSQTIKEFLNADAINEIIKNWDKYSILDYKFIGYDYDGNPKYYYIETINHDGVEIQLVYIKTIIN